MEQKKFKYMHPGCQRTSDVLNSLQFRNTKTFDTKGALKDMYTPLDNRYYKPKVSAKNRLALILSSKVSDLSATRKHDRVRRDPAERQKLEYLEHELSQSPRLRTVDNETEHFEQTTGREFTSQISQ